MSHFLSCESYENLPHENNWKDIKGNCIERQYEIVSIVKVRNEKRKQIIETFEAGHP
jgi:hypothetical protein